MPNFESIKVLERSLLAAVLISKSKSTLEEIDLTAADFSDFKCRNIYKAIIDVCFKDDADIDEASIIFKLDEIDDKINWVLELAELVNSTPTTLNPAGLAGEIKKASLRRQRLSLVDDFKADKISSDKFIQKFQDLISGKEKEKEIKIYDIEMLKNEKEQKFIIGLPAGNISVAAGAGGSGKTYMSLKLAFEASKENKKVLCWLTEDSKANVFKRLSYIKNVYKYKNDSTMYFVFDSPEQIIKKEYGMSKIDSHVQKKYQKLFSEFDLIILDPLMNFNVSDNNDNSSNRLFLNAMNDCISDNQVLLFLHHSNKIEVPLPSMQSILSQKLSYSETQDRILKVKGASSITETARHIFYVETNPINDNERIMTIIKSNITPVGGIIENVILPSLPSLPTEREPKNLINKEIDDDKKENEYNPAAW